MAWQAKRTRWGRSEEQRIGFLRQVLRRRRARLVLEHRGKQGHQYVIEPAGVRVSDAEMAVLIRRKLVRVLDRGLFDIPQSWVCS